MAKIVFSSNFDVDLSFAELAQIEKKDLKPVVMAGAEVYQRKQREWLEANTSPKATGKLAESIEINADNFELTGFVFVSPQGKHHGTGVGKKTRAAGYHRPKTGQGTSHKRKHHGMTNAVSAQDVGYYLEYGTPRMSARHWMEKANEQAADEAHKAMEKAWNAYLDSKGV